LERGWLAALFGLRASRFAFRVSRFAFRVSRFAFRVLCRSVAGAASVVRKVFQDRRESIPGDFNRNILLLMILENLPDNRDDADTLGVADAPD